MSRHQREHMEAVIRIVAERYGFTPEEIVARDRGPRLCYARLMAMSVVLATSDSTLVEISLVFHRSHGAIVSARKSAQGYQDVYPKEKEALDNIIEQMRVMGIDRSRWPGPPVKDLLKIKI